LVRATIPQTESLWQYVTNAENGSNQAQLPTRSIRTRDGKTIISDQFSHRVIIVDMAGKIVASFGNLNAPGFGTHNASEGLNALRRQAHRRLYGPDSSFRRRRLGQRLGRGANPGPVRAPERSPTLNQRSGDRCGRAPPPSARDAFEVPDDVVYSNCASIAARLQRVTADCVKGPTVH
jgi:hypothetical protein